MHPLHSFFTSAAAVTLTVGAIVLAQIGGHSQTVARSWPGLWGPNRTGLAADFGRRIGSFKEVWRRPTTGGYSEVAVSGSQAVTLELRGGDDFVIAVDAATGRERWSTKVGPTYRGHGGSHDGPIATPAIDGGDVFALGPHGLLLALDAATGKERWRHDLVAEFAATAPQWGFASSPLVEGTLVIVPTGGEKSRGLLAFDRATGRLVWSASHAKASAYASAVAGTIAGTRQILAAAGDRVFGVSPVDGSLLWSVAGPGTDVEVANSPVVMPGDRVLITSWNGAFALRLSREGGSIAAKEIWRSTFPRANNGPAIYRDGFLYGFAGPMLVSLNADTGAVRWRERTGEGTLVGAGEHVLVLSQTTGDLRVVRAVPDGYSEQGRTRVFTPDVVSVTGPSIADGRVFVRNLKEIAAFAVMQ
jgi:outer membrane protein assembly factor BamB